MLWKLLGRYTPNLRSGSELFRSLKSPLFSSHHFQCAVRINETAEQWIKTLAEDKQKRLRHIQSEVSINLAKFFLFACFSCVKNVPFSVMTSIFFATDCSTSC